MVLDSTLPPPADPESGHGGRILSTVCFERFARVMVMLGKFSAQEAEDFVDQLGFEMEHQG